MAARQGAAMTLTYETMPSLIGQELGLSPWIAIEQSLIDAFADVTQDHQWIHINPERTKVEGPYGTTIAHGYLTLSLIPHMMQSIDARPEGTAHSLNYGLDRLRFLNPVKAGSKIRLRVKLAGFDPRENGQYLMRMGSTVEIEGEERPALVAENLVLLVRA
jgi:acyl dehydratase